MNKKQANKTWLHLPNQRWGYFAIKIMVMILILLVAMKGMDGEEQWQGQEQEWMTVGFEVGIRMRNAW